MISAIVRRDVRLALRSGGAWLYGVFFFAVFIALSAIALGGSLDIMRPLAPALIWLAVIFSAMLSFLAIFQEDFSDGNLAQYKISDASFVSLCAAKAISFSLVSILPLLLAAPLAALVFDMAPNVVTATFASLALSTPALAAYGVLSSAILAGRRGGGFLIVLITTPFLIPVLIFGLEAIAGYKSSGFAAVEFRIVVGLSLIAIAVGLPAAAAALNAHLE
ncbi:heme exporter protein CcmB [Hellea balneolensis]|uniref:heme exporter protein CcmB n=1 Tax=Hellea balneolensis TaxID=287478 RepID=UPI0004181C8A|nr:heme exporter protein CcmB [Hellea balneolensis]